MLYSHYTQARGSKMETETKIKKDTKKRDRRKLTKKEKTIITLSIVIAALLCVTIWIATTNKALGITRVSIGSNKLPAAFDGYKIAHVSDLHNTEIGKGNERLIEKLRETEPDIIAITGDLIDSYCPDVEVSLAFVAEAVKIAPCYYVPGNHESRVSEYELLRSGLKNLGVTVLENEGTTLYKNDEAISIFGVIDPMFYEKTTYAEEKRVMEELLNTHFRDDGRFTLMLSHRPELFETYSDHPIELVLSGHAHGGQFRLPFIGGLYAPAQGAIPKYDSGIFTKSGTTMIVSRGIGNSAFPFRLNNNPELIIVELSASK